MTPSIPYQYSWFPVLMAEDRIGAITQQSIEACTPAIFFKSCGIVPAARQSASLSRPSRFAI